MLLLGDHSVTMGVHRNPWGAMQHQSMCVGFLDAPYTQRVNVLGLFTRPTRQEECKTASPHACVVQHQPSTAPPTPTPHPQTSIYSHPGWNASPPKTKICADRWAKCQAPAPKVMMPAGGVVPKWGHCHPSIMSGLSTSHIFLTCPICPQPNGWTTHPPIHAGLGYLLKKWTSAYILKYQPAHSLNFCGSHPTTTTTPLPPQKHIHKMHCSTHQHGVCPKCTA